MVKPCHSFERRQFRVTDIRWIGIDEDAIAGGRKDRFVIAVGDLGAVKMLRRFDQLVGRHDVPSGRIGVHCSVDPSGSSTTRPAYPSRFRKNTGVQGRRLGRLEVHGKLPHQASIAWASGDWKAVVHHCLKSGRCSGTAQ